MRVTLVLLAVSTLVFAYPKTPDFNKSPGHLCTTSDGHFSEYRYDERIAYCKRKVKKELKARIYDEYKIPEKDRRQYTIDHIIPLSIGGSNSPRNLWPEHKDVKATRPDLEFELFEELRDGEISQAEAVKAILGAKFNEDEDLPSSITSP